MSFDLYAEIEWIADSGRGFKVSCIALLASDALTRLGRTLSRGQLARKEDIQSTPDE